MKTYHQYAKDAWPGLKTRVRRRRRLNQAKTVVFVIAPMALILGTFHMRLSPAQEGSQLADVEQAADTTGSKVPPLPSLAIVSPEPASALKVTLSNEEALEKLADLGPIIFQLSDGSQHIVLTRPDTLFPSAKKSF